MAQERDTPVVALVTGARGIGFEVVRRLAQQDMTVVLAARDLDKAIGRLRHQSILAYALRSPASARAGTLGWCVGTDREPNATGFAVGEVVIRPGGPTDVEPAVAVWVAANRERREGVPPRPEQAARTRILRGPYTTSCVTLSRKGEACLQDPLETEAHAGSSVIAISASPSVLTLARNERLGVVPTCVGPPEGGRSDPLFPSPRGSRSRGSLLGFADRSSVCAPPALPLPPAWAYSSRCLRVAYSGPVSQVLGGATGIRDLSDALGLKVCGFGHGERRRKDDLAGSLASIG